MTALTILQWNVESREPFENVIAYLDAHHADVVCLQELTIGSPAHSHRHGPKHIAEQLGYRYCFVELPNTTLDGSRVTLANAILTSGDIEQVRTALITPAEERLGFEYQSRGYIEASLSLHGVEFTVATTHLGYSRAFEISARRHREAQRLLTEISGRSERFILAGDFNAEPTSSVISEVSRVLHHAGPSYDLPTWTTKPFEYDGFVATELRWRLDYVFVSADVIVTRAEILASPFSDHLPILCEVEVV